MECADRIRQPDAAFPARPDHAREFEDQLDKCPRGRSAYAARSWTTWLDRCRAVGWQNDIAEGNRECDPGESSRDFVYHYARGRETGGSDRSATLSRLRRLQIDLR